MTWAGLTVWSPGQVKQIESVKSVGECRFNCDQTSWCQAFFFDETNCVLLEEMATSGQTGSETGTVGNYLSGYTKLYFLSNFDFFQKISTFDEHFEVWRTFRFFAKISNFDQNFIFEKKIQFVKKQILKITGIFYVPLFNENFLHFLTESF